MAEEEERDTELLRNFSLNVKLCIKPSELLERKTASERRRKLLELWVAYYNCWEHDMLSDGAWWDRDGLASLASPDVMLLKPEGIFRGKANVLREYQNFADRFSKTGPLGRDARMDRRLFNVIVDEERAVTTSLFEVTIPVGILGGDAASPRCQHSFPSPSHAQGSGPGTPRSKDVFSVAEVVKWDVERSLITEIHYYGQGIKLTPSNLKSMLDRARQHSRRRRPTEAAGEDEFAAMAELGAGEGAGGGAGDGDADAAFGRAFASLDASHVTQDDRILAQLSVSFLRALLSCDAGVVCSLAAGDYKHR